MFHLYSAQREVSAMGCENEVSYHPCRSVLSRFSDCCSVFLFHSCRPMCPLLDCLSSCGYQRRITELFVRVFFLCLSLSFFLISSSSIMCILGSKFESVCSTCLSLFLWCVLVEVFFCLLNYVSLLLSLPFSLYLCITFLVLVSVFCI